MGRHLLEVLIPAVLSALLLGEGAQCWRSGYSLSVSSQKTVEDGLCVHIPCKFTYDSSQHPPDAEIYGYWYAEDEKSSKQKTKQHRLVASNDPNGIVDPQHFEMSATKLNHGDCSLTIRDARPSDQAKYHFQMEKGGKRHSYSGTKVSVKVTEKQVKMTTSGSVRAGKTEYIYCKTGRCSSSTAPTITWKSQVSGQRTFRSVNKGSSVESRMAFEPKAADHRQNVTCKVTYGEGSCRRSIEKTIMLNVLYPPTIRFSGRIQHPSGYVKDFADVYSVDARVNDSFLVRCEVDANPKSNQTWLKRISETWKPTSSLNELKISALKQLGERQYKCEASNKEGFFSEVFSLRVTGYDPSPTARP